MRLPRPLYEALPWLYLAGGAAALALTWYAPAGGWSNALFLAGLAGVIAGLTVLLRRRDYRDQQRRYGRDLDAE